MKLKFEEEAIDLGKNNLDLFKSLSGKTIFITGATGLIGSQLINVLTVLNKNFELNMKIVAFVRSIEKAHKKFNDIVDQIEIFPGDIKTRIDYPSRIDYIIHGASVTASRDFVETPIDTILTAIDGTKSILNLAIEKQVSGFVYLSSLEIYGNLNKVEINESDYGTIDPLNVRSSYSESKRMVETLCISYAHQYGVPVKIARLTQTFGPGVEYTDSRVFAQLARSVIEKKDIILHTTGETMRSYCYTLDAVSAIVHILLRGAIGEAYNVANEETFISIRDMAELACTLEKEKSIKVIIDMQDTSSFGYNPTIKINLKTNKLKSLGWLPTTDLKGMFNTLIESMLENKV
ncbi:NAD-dependent epimerase/dehydratase family protein [Streptococcus ovuberis]|uniref:NAD(P)-dependent oxidoreductase n=1 Tax=Streptococcus ovuberis TaxID=1936207 RepID=A0A7X6MXM8_9STRE|nr:NAD(P)-dependent oxidoreductase [Streptococcus ovuberis]NKZ19378.1 NAD(P)-dependent oxidoreductase [Streptococcus ovuberis]